MATSTFPHGGVPSVPFRLGQYVVGPPIAAGGMATVHVGWSVGATLGPRTVAIKRIHPHLAADRAFVRRFATEVRLASRVRHPNVVATWDVITDQGELALVLEYVHGVPLSALLARGPLPAPVAAALIDGVLAGLGATHAATSSCGRPLEIVHRDISPSNVIVGVDGVPRILDFGIARTVLEEESTRRGRLGKLAYMAPEQLAGEPIDQRVDVYAAGALLWEALSGLPLVREQNPLDAMMAIFHREVPRLSGALGVEEATDDLLQRALAKDPRDRFSSADEMRGALARALPLAPRAVVARWVQHVGRDDLASQSSIIAEAEGSGARLNRPRARRTGLLITLVALPVVLMIGAAATLAIAAATERAPELQPTPTLEDVDHRHARGQGDDAG